MIDFNLDLGGGLGGDAKDRVEKVKKENPQYDMSDDLARINAAIEEAKLKYDVKDEEELIEEVPAQSVKTNDSMELIKLNGLALTKGGEITRTKFFESLEITKGTYNDIVLSPKEARHLSNTYRKLTTGVNSTVPLLCTGPQCPFSSHCVYIQINKAPIGKPCLIEYDMLNYHTQKFFEEFDVQMQDHSEVMLIQELAELIVYEMRATRVLSEGEGAQQMMGIKIKFSPDGEQIEEETSHWAWDLKERIKNRRMKILDALNATRKAKVAAEAKKPTDGGAIKSYIDAIKEMKALVESAVETDYAIINGDSNEQTVGNSERGD